MAGAFADFRRKAVAGLNLHRWALGNAAPVTLATGARVVFGACLAAVVVREIEAQQSVRFFQLLFVQSIFITFVSGPGFVHAVAAVVEGRGGEIVQRYRRFVAVVAAGTLAIVWLSPAEILTPALGADARLLSLLVIGGASTALHGVLQAVVQSVRSPWHAFGPSVAVSLMAASLLFLPLVHDVRGVVAVLVIYQVGSLLVLGALSWRMLLSFARQARSGGEKGMAILSETSAIGLINCLSILVIYLLREYWTRRTSAELAEIVFFLWRMSDLYLGIVATLIAGSATMRRFRQEQARLPWHGVLPVVILIVAGGAGLTWVTLSPLPVIAAALIAQFLTELIRLPSVAATIAQVQSGKAPRYAAVVLPGPVIAAIAAAFLIPIDPLLAIYAFMALSAGLQLLCYVTIRLFRDDRRGVRRPR